MANRILFDTGALIDIYRGREPIRAHYESILAGETQAYISAITEAELWRGVKQNEIERHETIVSLFISLPLDSNAARLAGQWMREYESKGLGWMDALITATAKQADLLVLTRDAKLARVLSGNAMFEVYNPFP